MKREVTQPLHILLTEDTAAIQKLLAAILTGRGHRVELASTGQQAIKALEQDQFDLVLMDVTMPVMDGLEATAIIRDREKRDGSHVPILALTGMGDEGDEERCREAGMDGYIEKPVRASELLDAIDRFVPFAGTDGEAAAPTDRSSFREVAMNQVEGDVELLQVLMETIRDSAPAYMKEIQTAIQQGNCENLAASAHTMKAVFGSLGVNPAFETAAQLEAMGRTGNLAGADQTYMDLEKRFEWLMRELSAMVDADVP